MVMLDLYDHVSSLGVFVVEGILNVINSRVRHTRALKDVEPFGRCLLS